MFSQIFKRNEVELRMNKKLIEKFENIGSLEVSLVNNDTYETMKEVFENKPQVYFKQIDFVRILSRSNPFINHQLHKLLDNGVVVREGSKKQYFYRLK